MRAWPTALLSLPLLGGSACGAKTGLPLPISETAEVPDAAPPSRPEEPTPPNRPERPRAEKIDLLFVIDDSGSMGDKQDLLARAIPDIVSRLTNPRCVDAGGNPIGGASPPPGETCPEGTFREFNTVQDMHIGVITSSLGDHGAGSVCAGLGPNGNRGAHLVTGSIGSRTYEQLGFLAWDPAET